MCGCPVQATYESARGSESATPTTKPGTTATMRLVVSSLKRTTPARPPTTPAYSLVNTSSPEPATILIGPDSRSHPLPRPGPAIRAVEVAEAYDHRSSFTRQLMTKLDMDRSFRAFGFGDGRSDQQPSWATTTRYGRLLGTTRILLIVVWFESLIVRSPMRSWRVVWPMIQIGWSTLLTVMQAG